MQEQNYIDITGAQLFSLDQAIFGSSCGVPIVPSPLLSAPDLVQWDPPSWYIATVKLTLVRVEALENNKPRTLLQCNFSFSDLS